MNKKKKIINIVSTVLVIGLLTGGTFFLLSKLGVLNGESDGPKVLRLETPKNLRYDEATNTFKFDAVEHATNYIITYADTNFNEIASKNPTISVESNEVYFVPLYETTVIKVTAEDSTYEYAKSADSSTFTLVTKFDEGITVSSVNVFVNSLTNNSWSLEKVISMYINDGKLWTDAVFNYLGRSEMCELKTTYTTPVTNLTEAMDKSNYKSTSIMYTYSIPSQDYNSAQSMLDSGDLVGKLKEYKDSGYSISVVRSQTALTDDNTVFRIFATYKISNGQETKFIENGTKCTLNSFGINEKSNYTTKVADPSQRTLREFSSYEMTEDMATYFSKLENSSY